MNDESFSAPAALIAAQAAAVVSFRNRAECRKARTAPKQEAPRHEASSSLGSCAMLSQSSESIQFS